MFVLIMKHAYLNNNVVYVVLLASVKITLADDYMHIYCYCVNLRVSVYLHVHMIIYTLIVHSSRLYTMLNGYANYICWVCWLCVSGILVYW